MPCLESATIDEFGQKMDLHRTDVEHLRSVFMAVENGDIGMLKSLGIRVSFQKYLYYLSYLTKSYSIGFRVK